MGYWPKHPKKELQELLEEFDRAGWRIELRKGADYYRVYCACGGHKRMVHRSPSGTKYALDTRKWLHRQPCYTKGAQP